MTDVDEIILEIADERRTATSTSDVYLNWPTDKAERPTDTHINRRINTLAEKGFLKPVDRRGWYELDDLGERWLHSPSARLADFLPDEEEENGNGDEK